MSTSISFLGFLASSGYAPNRFRWNHFSHFFHPGRLRQPRKGPHPWLLQVRKSRAFVLVKHAAGERVISIGAL
jgi:hypothetical protein